ncbi:MAG: hypothetical protein IJG84_11930 [Kiritimatiellae bacterium]|nr:hypothetical protein [Kiritimatiellia bacterium]
MNELIGMLIPLLMSGAGLGDILRTLGGAGQSAAGMDGLSSVMSTSMMRAKQYFPLKQNQQTINSAAEMLADRLGINPYSGLGQGMVHMLGSAYHVAPDMIGGILGIPNGQQFFSQIANGASISLAAGYGQTDVLNPYSVMANHKRAMDMAKTVYDLGVKQGGGYDISYSHGLNMEEMGKVTQRLLSSRMAYREVAEGEDGTLMENGKDISFDKESDKFKENIKKLGSKFNEAASMLSKVTGSVEEALNMMDRIAGGNFLGGTAEQASKAASQAKRMATAIRVTSAIAGISPTEAYANMMNLQNGMATGMGMSSYIANASGFSSLMGDMAFNATMGYNTWLAMNPNASPMQKQQALLAVNGRAQAYSSSNAAALSAAIADNANMFSPEEQKQIQDAMRSGHPEAIVELVRSRIGESMYNTYMTDPSVQAAARYRASKDERSSALLKDLDQANIEGNLQQVEDYGARLMTRRALSDLEDDLARRSGKTDFAAGRTDAVKRKFVEMAVKQGMTQKGAEAMDVNDLRVWLQNRPGLDKSDLAKAENLAEIQEAGRQIDSLTMDDMQEEAARNRLIKEIDNTTWNEDKKRELKALAGKKGANLEAIANEAFSGKTVDERKELTERVFKGRFSQAGAAEKKMRLERLEKSQDQNYTVDERMAAITRDSARQDLTEMGGLKKKLSSNDLSMLGEADALREFASEAVRLEGKGLLSLGGDKDLSKTYNEAARRMVSGIFGDKLGNMEGDDLKQLETRLSEEIVKGMMGGSTFQEAFAASMKNLSDEDKAKIGFGKDKDDNTLAGEKTVNDFIEKAERGDLKDADRKAFLATTSSVIDERSKGAKADAIKEMTRLAKGDIGDLSEADAFKRFTEIAKTVGGYDISDEEFDKLSAEKAKSIGEKGSAQKAMSDMLGAMKPRGQRDLGFFAMSGTGSPDKAGILMAATMFKMAGGDMSKLNLGKEWEDILSTIDDEKAGRTMNAVSNAIHVGGASYQKEAIKSAETQALRLGELVNKNKTLLEDAKAAYGTGPDSEKAKERLLGKLKALGSSDANSDAAMIATLQGQTIGGQNAMEVMQKGKKGLEAAKKDAGDKYDEQMVGVVRESARKDSAAYDIGKAIGDFTRMISPFIQDPASVFKSPIPVKMWGPVDLSGKGTWP